MFNLKTIVLSLVALVIVLSGCAKKKDVIATIGKEEITVNQFKDAFIQRYRSEDNAKTRTLDERKKVVEDMAIGLAKYQEGLTRGIDKRPETAADLDKVIKRKALDLLYQKKVVDAVVTDEAAKHFYDKSGEEVKARHILLKLPTDTSETAIAPVKMRIDSIKKAISNGLDFKTAAKMFSEDATSSSDSGDLGWFQWGRMVDEFQEAVWGAQVNKVTNPIKTPYGYHLVLLEEKRPVQDRRPFEESKEKIKSQLREVESQKMGDVAKEYVAKLRKDNKVEYMTAVTTAFQDKLKDPNTPKTGGPIAPLFTEAEKKQVAASYKGGKVTVGDMLEKLGNNAGRVDWTQKQSTLDLINAIIEPKLLDDNAKSLGLEKEAAKDPSVIEQKKNAIVRSLEKEEVSDKVNPTEADERQYYQTHLDAYIQPETRRIREIFIKTDSVKCARVRDRAVKGENFTKLALRFNEKESTKNDTGRIGPLEQKQFGLIGVTAFQLQKPGDVSNVVRLGENFSVIQLLDIIPSRTKSFEEASAQVKREYRAYKTDELQKALEKAVLSKYKFNLDEAKLSTIWPLPVAGTPKQEKKVAREP